MLKISKQASITLSLIIAILFFLGCIAALFILPNLTELLINLPDNIGDRASITPAGRTLVLIAAYCILADFIFADILLFTLLLRVKRGLVFTMVTVSLVRGVSWCCIGLFVLFCLLGYYFQLSLPVALMALFLGLCLRVCKNAFEEATQLKQENDLTV